MKPVDQLTMKQIAVESPADPNEGGILYGLDGLGNVWRYHESTGCWRMLGMWMMPAPITTKADNNPPLDAPADPALHGGD